MNGPDAKNAPNPGLDRLIDAKEAIGKAQGTEAARQIVLTLLGDAGAIAEIVETWLASPLVARAAILALRQRGITREVDALLKAVEAAVREATRAKHVVVPDLGTEMPPLRLPPGWVIDDGGISRDRGEMIERVTHAPLLVTGVLESVRGAQRVWLQWRNGDGRWLSTTVRRSAVRDVRAIVSALADGGADVTSNNAKDVVQWLADLDGVNDLPRALVSETLGWQGETGDRGFLLGRRLCAPPSPNAPSPKAEAEKAKEDDEIDPDAPPSRWGPRTVILHADEGLAQVADGFAVSGDRAAWVAALDDVWGYPSVVIGLYASLAAPYLGIIPNAPNAIIDWSGETSHGKTTALRVAASVWGNPDERAGGIVHSWKATPSSIERIAGLCQHVPLFLDDTKQASSPEFVRDMIYLLAGGRGKTRATPDGMRTTAAWRMPLLSTGESAITSFSQDAGARARCLCLTGLPFKDGARGEQVWRLTETVAAHHGHAGRELVTTLAARRATWRDIQQAYDSDREAWAARAQGGPAARAAATLALIETGARAAHEILGLPEPDGGRAAVLAYAWEAATRGILDTDRPLAALEAVYRWAVAHSSEFWGRHEMLGRGPLATPRQPGKGWAGAWGDSSTWPDLAFVPEVLDRVLRFHGHEPSGIIEAWLGRGWLARDGRHKTRKRNVGRESSRCYVFLRETFQKAGISD